MYVTKTSFAITMVLLSIDLTRRDARFFWLSIDDGITRLRFRNLELIYLHSGIVQRNRLTVDTVPMIRMMTVQLSFNVTLIIIQYNFIFVNAVAMCRAVVHYV